VIRQEICSSDWTGYKAGLFAMTEHERTHSLDPSQRVKIGFGVFSTRGMGKLRGGIFERIYQQFIGFQEALIPF
jgi:transcriptional regulator of nitric oxide reductase